MVPNHTLFGNDPTKNLDFIDESIEVTGFTCEYISPNEYDCKQFDKVLNIMHLNIHSLPNKLQRLRDLIYKFNSRGVNIDVILLCETFINEKNKMSCAMNDLNYELIEEHRQTMSRGGVAIYINNKLKYKIREDLKIFKEGKIESCFIEVLIDRKAFIIGEMYRVPGHGEDEFIQDYQNLVSRINLEKKQIIIGTDQNMDLLKADSHKNTQIFLEYNLENGLIPSITKPTRITASTATLIDNIYVPITLKATITSSIVLTELSDHLPCMIQMTMKCKEKQNYFTEKRVLNALSYVKIRNEIQNIDINVFNDKNVNESYEYLLYKINTALDKYASVKRVFVNNKSRNEPWFTQGLHISSVQCDKLYKKCVGKHKDDPTWVRYRMYRNCYNKAIRRAKKVYFTTAITKYKNNSSALWNIIKKAVGKCTDKRNVISEIENKNGNLLTDTSNMCNEFNKYFSSVGKDTASKVSKTVYTPDMFLNKYNDKNMFLYPCTPEEVYKTVKSLKSKNSAGNDGISNNLIKKLSDVLCLPLCIIFNKSFSEAVFPDKMKLSKVIPLYKGKSKTNVGNYRPVSLLPSISKALEKLVHKRLYNFLVVNDMLYKSQYGFRSGLSTIDAVSELIGKTVIGCEEGNYTLCVLLDLSKAFDTISHDILLMKLNKYGIRGHALNWFCSYLSHRKQYVEINNIKSEEILMEYGVPQGSVLGPLLFIIMINDITNSLQHSKCIIYADDTTLYLSGKNLDEMFTNMNKDLNAIEHWFACNSLLVNVSKTNFIVFRPKNKECNLDKDLHYLILNNELIKNVDYCKFLGLWLDKKVTWQHHLDTLCNKLNSCLYMLKMTKFFVPEKILKLLFNSYFQSHLRYGISLWGPMCNKTDLRRISKIHKKAVKILNGSNVLKRGENVYKKQNVLTIDDQVELEICKIMYRHVNNSLPPEIKAMLQGINCNNLQVYNTRSRNVPRIGKHKSKLYNTSFLCQSIMKWTPLPCDIKNCNKLSTFCKKYVKFKMNNY